MASQEASLNTCTAKQCRFVYAPASLCDRYERAWCQLCVSDGVPQPLQVGWPCSRHLVEYRVTSTSRYSTNPIIAPGPRRFLLVLHVQLRLNLLCVGDSSVPYNNLSGVLRLGWWSALVLCSFCGDSIKRLTLLIPTVAKWSLRAFFSRLAAPKFLP